MEALIQHFLIYSQGFTVPAGEAYVPVEGPRGEQGFSVWSDGTNRPWRIKSRAPSLLACQALERMIVGGLIADVIAVIGSIDVLMGDVDGWGRLETESGHLSSQDDVGRDVPQSVAPARRGRPALRIHRREPRPLRRVDHAVPGRSEAFGGPARAVPRAIPAGIHHG